MGKLLRQAILLIISLFEIPGYALSSPATLETRHIELPIIRTELRPEAGREKVEKFCNICHSLDYIPMQPGLSKNQWTALVGKMIKVYGAPITDEDSSEIANYLSRAYGKGN